MPAAKQTTKQMKVFLTIDEHTVVTAAANLRGMHVGEYMKKAILENAKEDAREMTRIIDSL